MRRVNPIENLCQLIPAAISAAAAAISAAAATALLFFLIALPTLSSATPVYLRLDSQFPSGNLSRNWLEAHTKRVQFQRWLRVETEEPIENKKTSDKPSHQYGWLPEDHLVTGLNLASEAILNDDVPARSGNEMDAVTGHILKKSSRVMILDVQGSWAQVNPLPINDKRPAWVPTSALRALQRSPAQKTFIHHRATVFSSPGLSSRKQGEFSSGRYVALLGRKGDWLEVQYRGMPAWIKHHDAWILSDMTSDIVAIATPNAPLRSAPLPYADLVTNLKFDQRLRVIEEKQQRFGLVHVSQNGDLWWPISEDGEDEHDLRPSSMIKIATQELFARKIFDMATSTSTPSLKIVSAQGIYRTLDGQEWTKIPMFKNQNYPIAIAKAGPIFVGPYLSEDSGETFQTWIRYDKLVATLRSRYSAPPQALQIVEIKPEDPGGHRVRLKLNIGLKEDVSLLSEDQGLHWRAL